MKSTQSIQDIGKSIKPVTTPHNEDVIMQDTMIVNKDGLELGIEHDLVFNTQTGVVNKFSVEKDDEVKDVKIEKVIASSESTTIIQTPDENQKSEEKGFPQLLKSFFSK